MSKLGVISKEEAFELDPKLAAAYKEMIKEEGHTLGYYNQKRERWKRGQLVVIYNSEYSSRNPNTFQLVKVTSVKHPGSDYEVIRVSDGEYSWRI